MEITRRVPTEVDRRQAVRGISIFQPRLRRLAKREAASGHIEMLRFRATRAWNIISCAGPPCCPNTWLLETTHGEYVWVESWRDLTADAERFPGADVTIERWGESHRILGAKSTDSSILTHDGTDIGHLAPATEVEVFERGQLPDEIRAAIASV